MGQASSNNKSFAEELFSITPSLFVMHSWRHKQFMYDVDINFSENQFVEISFNTLILKK